MAKTDRTIRLATEADQKAWDRTASHPLGSWAWGEFRRAMGVDVVRLAVLKNTNSREGLVPPVPNLSEGRFSEGWQLTFHKIPSMPWTIGYFPKGPAPTKQMVEELAKLGREKRAIFIQLEPDVLANNGTMKQWNNVKSSHHPLFTKYTFLLDLTKPEDQLLTAMHPKTRYNIRLAKKHGVGVSEDNSSHACEAYLRLTRETTGRQGFYAHNTDYHRKMWEIMHKANVAHLFTATYQGKTLAAWIVFVWKDTIYYPYGASSREHRDVMAPTLLLWEIIRWAKRKGLKQFDLWGALGPSTSWRISDPWYGFHRFKQGFNPTLVEFIGSYDLVINPVLYRLYTFADTLRWFILKRLL